ncbi:serine/threonine transporter SstT [Pseudomonas berkeleyensis]|uniref:Serine/threonine transporter SstT n=1 Tax=Pseudomonas berkeleyensis TaxID=2726956 RepID=A0A7G5DNP5_9PSED|nr:serine/threonine transporter SstT [Pseudomonas berkeleyensis]QMV63370.1 serine/threonine transporter SstT [Pseudomonas berkeleyensis]WSO38831.1 serine/threonine transporter SstT [Pseudomonas berkeleyensis]
MNALKLLAAYYSNASLVLRIFIGLVLGTLLAWIAPAAALKVGLFGELFILALKAVAPILVLVLVTASLASRQSNQPTHIRPVLMMYLISTFSAAALAVCASFLFPTLLTLDVSSAEGNPPGSIIEVLHNLLTSIFVGPVQALNTSNYIAILAWAVLLGVFLRHAAPSTRTMLTDVSNAFTKAVQFVINLAPIGIFGLVASTLADSGFEALITYARLLIVMVSCMLIVTFVINPLIAYIKMRRNPYPLLMTVLRESAVTAFFTRSSAANIPVNLRLCEKLKLDRDTYSITIPLGATINMAGAAVTISVMALAATHTLGIPVDLPTALLLCVVSSLAAAGVSGVAGGSLLLIPMATSLFGIDAEIAMQVVSIGFVISVVQDSFETALNSHTDVVFTAAVSYANQAQEAGSAVPAQSNAAQADVSA